MADWTLISLDTPLAGSSQRTELSMASNRKMTFSLTDSATLSFSLPGRHWQTEHVEPLKSDILLFRDGYCVQRFRVVSSSFTKSLDGSISAEFTAVSYKELLNGWIFHPTHTRRFVSVEQTAIAWTIINETQTMNMGDIKATRGILPVNPVIRTLQADDPDTPEAQRYYFDVGKRKGDAVREIASMDSGFEWDIEPDRTSSITQRTSLKFNTWNAGQRSTTWPVSPLVLDDGGNVLTWRKQVDPSEYANVVHGRGTQPEDNDDDPATEPPPPPQSWYPASKNPSITAWEGRWERSFSFDASAQTPLDDLTAAKQKELVDYEPSWQVDLAPGRWEGPAQMWLGDNCRFVIDDGPVFADFDARVVKIDISLTDEGLERISLDLTRERASYYHFRKVLNRRLVDLERRRK